MKSYYKCKIAKQIKEKIVIFPNNPKAIKPVDIIKLLKLGDNEIPDTEFEMCIISAYSHPNIQTDLDKFSELNNSPKSKITLILAQDDDFDNLSKCIIKANSLPNILTVCMPWSFDESKINERIDSKLFTSKKIIYCASTGNYKDYEICPYPASSPNVCAVGGTLVDLDKIDESIIPEFIYNGSGCGKSKIFDCHKIQSDFFKQIGKSDIKRCVPDVSLFSNSCVAIIINGVESSKLLGGTSLSTTLFSAMINLALTKINKCPDNLNEIITKCIYHSGSNIKHYDDYIGLGSPIFDLFVETLEYFIKN